MINAGKYRHKIVLCRTVQRENARGFQEPVEEPVLTCYAAVKTTRGMTLIRNGTDFEKAYTNFTIRYPKTPVDRDMHILFGEKTYTVEYLNNVDEAGAELEIQAKEVTH